MSLQSGSNIVTKNLVFGYDTQGRFYKGEPTENLFTKYGIELVGGNSNCTYGSDDIGTYFIKNDNTKWYAGIYLQPTNVLPGKAYTMSFEIMCDINFTCHWDANDYASNYSGNDACREATLDYSPTYTTPNKWQKVYIINKIFSDAVNPQAGSGFCPQDTKVFGHKIYYRNLQVEIKDHPTKYTSTSRLNNNSLIDLAGNTSIDLSNISFDSASKPYFNGINNYVSVNKPDGFGITNLPPNITLNMWVKLERKNGASYQHIAGFRNNSNFDFYFLLLDTNGETVSTEARIRTTSNLYNINVPFVAYFNTWTNITFVGDINQARLYINGELVGSVNINGLFGPTAPDFYIGYEYTPKGYISNVSLYNRALTVNEIKQNYNASKNKFK